MGMRGEIKSYKLADKDFTYFINIKEDRYKTIFLNLVLSERINDEYNRQEILALSEKVNNKYKRQEILIYREDFDNFLLELEKMRNVYNANFNNEDKESYYKAELETERRIYNFVLKRVIKNNKKSIFAKLTETLKFAPNKISNILIFERNFKDLYNLLKTAINFIQRFSKDEEE